MDVIEPEDEFKHLTQEQINAVIKEDVFDPRNPICAELDRLMTAYITNLAAHHKPGAKIPERCWRLEPSYAIEAVVIRLVGLILSDEQPGMNDAEFEKALVGAE